MNNPEHHGVDLPKEAVYIPPRMIGIQPGKHLQFLRNGAEREWVFPGR